MSDLDVLAETHLAAARQNDRGRSAALLVSDAELRQTLVALVAGAVLGEHNSPPAASLQVLRGSVEVTAGDEVVTIRAGHLRVLTHERHAVRAPEDAVFLLTTVTSTGEDSHS